MFFNSSDYPKNKVYRADRMREGERERLAKIAQDGRADRQWSGRAVRVAMVAAVIALVILAIFGLPQAASAQTLDMAAQGPLEAWPAPVMMAYRLGNYYLVKGHYERAADYFSEAIAQLPEGALDLDKNYAFLYWDLENAQFEAGQTQEALASYQQFLALMGDLATEEETAYVHDLAVALDRG